MDWLLEKDDKRIITHCPIHKIVLKQQLPKQKFNFVLDSGLFSSEL